MQTVKFVCWEDDGMWLGYLSRVIPTTGPKAKHSTISRKHLEDLFRDLTSGQIPGVRRVEELVIS